MGYFLGCVRNVVFAGASRATVKLLSEFNCAVVTPKDQMCCGAPQDDQGLKDAMRKMAKKNIEAFEQLGDLDVIVADCAACLARLPTNQMRPSPAPMLMIPTRSSRPSRPG